MLNRSLVDSEKKLIGKDAVIALNNVFNQAKGKPPSVPANRFRADNPELFDILDSLEHMYSLLKRTDDHQGYIINSYALPLIEEYRAVRLLEIMNSLLQQFKRLYSENLNKPLSIEVLLDGVNGEKKELLEGLYYFSELHGTWSGRSIGFPYSDSSYLSLSESLLKYENISDIISQHYDIRYKNNNMKSSFYSLMDAINIKPTAFGVSIDVKKIFISLFKK